MELEHRRHQLLGGAFQALAERLHAALFLCPVGPALGQLLAISGGGGQIARQASRGALEDREVALVPGRFERFHVGS